MSFCQPNGCSIRLRCFFVQRREKSLEELRQFRQIVRGVGCTNHDLIAGKFGVDRGGFIDPVDAFENGCIFEKEDFGYNWLWIRLWIFRVSVLCKHVKRFIFVLFLSAING